MSQDLITKLKLENSEFKKKLKETQAELNLVKKSAASIHAPKSSGFSKLGNEIQNVKSTLSGLSGGIGGVASVVESIGTKMGPVGMAVGAVAAGAITLGAAAVKAASEVETLDTNLGTLLGSQEKGIELRKELQKYGQATPYDTKGLVQATTTMLGYGVAQQKVMPLMRQLGDIAMGNSEHLNSLALAFGQMSAVGKVTKGDLNQMANAGFGFNNIAKSMGISIAEFQEKLSKGQVSIQDVEKALKDATSAGGSFYHSAINSSATLDGILSNLSEAATSVLADIGQSLLPMVKDAANGLVTALEGVDTIITALTSDTDVADDSFDGFGAVINDVKDIMFDMQAAFSDLIDLIDTVVSSFGDASDAGSFLADVFDIIYKAVSIVWKLIRAFINTIREMIEWLDSSSTATTTLGQVFQDLVAPIKVVISWIKSLIEWLKEAFDWLSKVLDSYNAVTSKNNKQTRQQVQQNNKNNKQTTPAPTTPTNTPTAVSTPKVTVPKHTTTRHTPTRHTTTTHKEAPAPLGSLKREEDELRKLEDAFSLATTAEARWIAEQKVLAQQDVVNKIKEQQKDQATIYKINKQAQASMQEQLKNISPGKLLGIDMDSITKNVQDSIKNNPIVVPIQIDASNLSEDVANAIENLKSTDMSSLIQSFEDLGKIFNSEADNSTKAASGLVTMGQALQAIGGSGAVAKTGAILAAIGQIILGFGQASAQAASGGPWVWLGFIVGALATVAATISQLKSFANGGIVSGSSFAGDNNLVRVNSSEMILNGSQQKKLFSLLDSNSSVSTTSPFVSTVKIKGSDLYLTLSNYNKLNKFKGGVKF